MILAALALALAIASPAETPTLFISRVYASYRERDFSPFKQPEQYFAPRLLAAINEDSRLNQGEVGYLDGDPICQCQDAAGLSARVTGTTAGGRNRASVSVSISLQGYEPRRATYSLIRTKAGWRISDISSAGEPSLLRGLERSNRKPRATKR